MIAIVIKKENYLLALVRPAGNFWGLFFCKLFKFGIEFFHFFYK